MRRSLILAAAILAAATCAYSQQWNLDSLPQYHPEQKVAGTIRSWGNDAMADLMKYWEEGFHKYHPDVRFEDTLQSTALAVPALCTGVADLGVMGREIWPIEVLAYQRVYKNPPLTVTVATGTYNVENKTWALVVFVHKDNPISKLTMKQLDGIFGSERSGGWDDQKVNWLPEKGRGPEQDIRTWGQLGLSGEWKDKPIHVYGFDLTRSGFSFAFAEKVFRGGDKWNASLKELVAFNKPDGTPAAAPPQVTEALGQDRYGIAYDSILCKTPLVKPIAVALNGGGPYIEPTKENVQNRTYPLIRSVFIHAKRAPGKPLDPPVREFLSFILSREGQQAVVREGDYLPLTAEAVREQLRKLE